MNVRGQMKTRALYTIVWFTVGVGISYGQKFEATALIGAQINGRLDLSTTTLSGIEVENGMTRGLGFSYQPGKRSAIEFMWTYDNPDTIAQSVEGGPSAKIFILDTNRYFGNFLFHFAEHEQPTLRPFVLAGLGAITLTPARSGVTGITRLGFAVGGGVKYNFSRLFGLRLQAKWSPTYLSTTQGYWCDPAWGGCWGVGRNHYLNALDFTAGLTVRF